MEIYCRQDHHSLVHSFIHSLPNKRAMDAILIDQAGDDASARFINAQKEIERVKSGIADTRSGTGTIVDISNDAKRLKQRVAREGIKNKAMALERINNIANFQDVCI